jgi:hypothetical protein
MQYRDVVIHFNAGIFGKEFELKKSPSITAPINLSANIGVGRIDPDTANKIMDTCEPKTFGVHPAVTQFAQLYSFVRELESDDDIYRWDHDNQLSATVALSRLIHPTSTGFTSAARIDFEKDGVKQIFPARISGVSKDAFLSVSRTRDWLTEADAKVLAELVPAITQPLPSRIHNALWHHEYAIRTYYLDHRWTLVCTGLEALLHTDKYKSTAEFKNRVPMLAAEVGIKISPAEARDAYGLRSMLAHGAAFLSAPTTIAQTPSADQLDIYDRLEDTLRLAILKGMLDKKFGDIFHVDAEIAKRWPI